MKMTRRVLALLLALCLMFGNVMPAMATGLEGEDPAVTEETTPMVPEVEETEAPTEEPTEEPTAAPTEAPTEPIVEETIAPVVDEVSYEVDQNGLLAEFTFGTGTSTTWTDGNSFTSKSYTAGDYTLNFTNGTKVYNGGWDTNKKGFIKFGTGSAVGSLSFTVPEDVTSVVLHLAGYKGNTGKYTINGGTTQTLTKLANNGEYEAVEVDTSENKTVAITTVSGGYRMVMYTVAYYGGGEVCNHEWDEGVVTAPTCTVDGYTTYTCTLCGTTKKGGETAKTGHNYENGACTACGEAEPVTPTTPAEIVDAAYALESNTALEGTYTLTGKITSIKTAYDSGYKNISVVIEVEGKEDKPILCYRLTATDKNDTAKLEELAALGANDTITVTGTLKNYNGTIEFDAGCTLDKVVKGETIVMPEDPKEIVDAAYALEDGKTLPYIATLTGKIVEIDKEYDSSYKNISVVIAVEGKEDKPILCYRMTATDKNDETKLAELAALAVDDVVTVSGSLTNYSGTIEFTAGCTLDAVTKAGPKPGTEENPIEVTFTMTPTEGTATVTIPANTTHYFFAYGVGGKELFINGVGGTILSGNPRVASVFSVENTTDAEAEFALAVRIPLGSMDNPAALADGANTANIAAGSQGYFYTWTAPADGKLTVEISSTTGWTYAINNLTSYVYGDTQWSDSDPVENPAVLDVAKGDELQIMVNTYDPANPWNAPAGAVTVTTSFAALGSEANPVEVTFEMNEDYTEGTATVTVPANTTYYCSAYGIGGMLLSINDGEGTMMGGNPRMPVIFPVENTTDADAEFTLTVAYPVGSMMNPETLEEGQSVVSIAAGNGEGHFYTWTAPADGKLTVEISATPGWTYAINNLTTSTYGDTQWSDSDPVENPAVLDVAKGDEIQIMVNTYDPADEWNVPAGAVTVTTSFDPLGSATNPIYPEFVMNEKGNAGTVTVTVPAKTTLYFASWADGMILTINGVEYGTLTCDRRMGMPATWTITNEGNEDAEYVLDIAYPVGHMMNPAELVDGENVTTIEAGNDQGYFYSFVAETRGILTLEIVAETGWTYQITNVTAGVQDDIRWSDDEEVANPVVLDLLTGEEIQIMVNTYDPNAPWAAPAGEITLNTTFEAAQGSSLMPDTMNVAEYEWETSENIVDIPEGIDGYFFNWTAYASGKLTIDVSNGKAGWAYQIQNLTPRAIGEWHYSYDVPTVNSETIYVNEGETIAVVVNTCGETAEDITPAGSVYFYATFEKSTGTEENPLVPEWIWNDAWTEATATITVPADSSIFVAFNNEGMMLSINDGEPEAITGNRFMPQTIKFDGAEEGETVYTLKLTHPVGSAENPAELVMGENTATFAEGSQGSVYTFVAEENGTLTITMPEGDWSYTINNLTTYVYGETQYSEYHEIDWTTGEVVETIYGENPAVIDVMAGDELQIMVNTYDPADEWNTPAGTITFTAEFAPAVGTASNPEVIENTWFDTWMHLEQGDEDGYYYSYTAQASGTLEFQVFDVMSGAGADIIVDVIDPETSVSTQYTLSADGKKGVLPVDVTEGDELLIQVVAAPDAEGNYYTETEFIWGFRYEQGHFTNPAVIKPGKNSVKLAAGSNGYYYYFPAELTGYLTITMSGKNWAYQLDYDQLNRDENGNILLDENGDTNWVQVYGEPQIYGEGGQKSQTVYLPDDWSYGYLYVNTANGKAGTITFTAAFKCNVSEILAGKSQTLTFTDPATGKAIKASNANWEITDVMIGEESVEAEAFADYATLANGKITAAAGLTEEVTVYALATLKTDKTVANSYIITIRPAAEEITFNAEYDYGESEWTPDENGPDTKWVECEEPVWVPHYEGAEPEYNENGEPVDTENGHWEFGYEEHGYWGEWIPNWVTEENITELNYIINGNTPQLYAVVGPDAAKQEVTWKSSNTKILNVYPEIRYDEETDEEYQIACLEPVFNAKTGKYATGTVTLTATAADGSGVKASIKVNVSLNAYHVDLTTKNDQYILASGKSMTFTATPIGNYWYEGQDFMDVAINGKTVEWSMLMWDAVWVPNEGCEEEEPNWDEENEVYTNGYYEYAWVEVPASVATLSQKGVLKAGKVTDRSYDIGVTAKVTNADGTTAENSIMVSLLPAAKSVAIDINEGPYDVNSSEEFHIGAYTQVKIPDVEELIPAAPVALWTTSNAQIVELVELDEPYEEYDYDEDGNQVGIHVYTHKLVFNGKTGKVTLTAHANDGSGAKKSVTINVVKAPSAVEITSGVDVLTAGKSATFKAAPYVEVYNPDIYMSEADYAVSNKGVNWSVKVVEYNDDICDYEEVDNTIGAKIDKNGKLTTNAKLVKEVYTLAVTATAKMTGLYGEPVSYTTYVTVYPATTNVTLYRFGKAVTGTLNLDKDSYAVLHAEGSPADAYTWTTSNAKIATIENNADGSVTVRPTGKLGTVTITATAADGTNKSAKVSLKILEKIDALEIAEVGVAATKSVNLNNFLTINPSNATMKKVTWSWEYEWDAEYYKALGITLNANGTLSAAKVKNLESPIEVGVRAVAADGLGAQQYATVTIYPATTKVELVEYFDGEQSVIPATGNTVSHKLGQWQMSAVGYATINKEYVPGVVADNYKWTSSNAKVATVDQNGLVTFKGVVGSVTIKATATDGTNKSAQTTIKVIKDVEKVYIPAEVTCLAKGKTVTLSKSVVFEPADATNKGLTWSIVEMKKYNEATGEFDLDATGAATLNAKTGALKAVNVDNYVVVVVGFTAADGFGASGETVVLLAPNVIKGVKIMDQNNKVDQTRKIIETTEESVKLYPMATNDSDKTAPGFTCTVSNKNFEAVWDGEYVVVQAIEGAANPYGTVKVTIKAADGSNVSNYTTIKFVQPEPAT